MDLYFSVPGKNQQSCNVGELCDEKYHKCTNNCLDALEYSCQNGEALIEDDNFDFICSADNTCCIDGEPCQCKKEQDICNIGDECDDSYRICSQECLDQKVYQCGDGEFLVQNDEFDVICSKDHVCCKDDDVCECKNGQSNCNIGKGLLFLLFCLNN